MGYKNLNLLGYFIHLIRKKQMVIKITYSGLRKNPSKLMPEMFSLIPILIRRLEG